jgi:bifunctional UDP-N-acetylglucosamine pyrophosphorylase/glucosamine-1-phosphate N-acetyltransferase
MKSDVPKVLHPVAGRPMIAWSVQAANEAGAREVIVVLGYGREAIEAALAERFGDGVRVAVQKEQRGTGDAVRSALPLLPERDARVVVLYGDCPLVPAEALRALDRAAKDAPLAMLTMALDDPSGYGRILRDGAKRITGVREHRDATPYEREIREVNPGMYSIDAAFLRASLAKLEARNAQGELYLTDLVERAAEADEGVADVGWPAEDLAGINDRFQLAAAEHAMRMRIVRRIAEAGATVRDVATTHVDADVVVEPDATLEPGVVLRGRTIVRSLARVDVGCVLEDVEVASGAWVKPYTVATRSRIGPDAQTGPFAHLRPGSELGPKTRIGNFVETKNTRLGEGSKANHLAYLGDGEIGAGVNIGAGTIFCNYDGFMKHVTTLEDGAFIGSDCQLVAPIRVGTNAYVSTGTTVTLVEAPAAASSEP